MVQGLARAVRILLPALAAGVLATGLLAAETQAGQRVRVSGTVVATGAELLVRDDLLGDCRVAWPDLTLHRGKAVSGLGFVETRDNGERVLTLESFEVIAPDADECAAQLVGLPAEAGSAPTGSN